MKTTFSSRSRLSDGDAKDKEGVVLSAEREYMEFGPTLAPTFIDQSFAGGVSPELRENANIQV